MDGYSEIDFGHHAAANHESSQRVRVTQPAMRPNRAPPLAMPGESSMSSMSSRSSRFVVLFFSLVVETTDRWLGVWKIYSKVYLPLIITVYRHDGIKLCWGFFIRICYSLGISRLVDYHVYIYIYIIKNVYILCNLISFTWLDTSDYASTCSVFKETENYEFNAAAVPQQETISGMRISFCRCLSSNGEDMSPLQPTWSMMHPATADHRWNI